MKTQLLLHTMFAVALVTTTPTFSHAAKQRSAENTSGVIVATSTKRTRMKVSGGGGETHDSSDTCNSSGELGPCEPGLRAECDAIEGGMSSEPGGGETCTKHDL